MPFDWTAIMDRNRADLVRLVAMLAAMIGADLSREVYLAMLRRLRPLESALRRLIVIAARDVVVVAGARAMPEGGIARGRRGGMRVGAFPLFDPRRALPGPRHRGACPRIRSFDEPAPAPRPPAPERIDPARLLHRLERMRRALGRLPQQARRLARWRRRNPTSLRRPMRPGRPPGYWRRAGADEGQAVLQDLQVLALWAMAEEA